MSRFPWPGTIRRGILTHMRIPLHKLLTACAVGFGACNALAAQDGPSQIDGIGAFPYQTGSTRGVSFRVWAPNAVEVNVLGSFNFWNPESHPLFAEGGGYWSVQVPYALPGTQYKFRFDTGDQILERNDARAYDVTSSVGNSVVYDPDAYEWQNTDFQTPDFDDLVIYECIWEHSERCQASRVSARSSSRSSTSTT